MKRYVRFSTLDISENTAHILEQYKNTDNYLRIKYYKEPSMQDHHAYEILYIKVLKVSAKTCDVRCYSGINVYLTNQDNVMYPPRFQRLKLNCIEIPEDYEVYTFDDLYNMVCRYKGDVNLPSKSKMQFY